jgi:hypothetical protein
MMPAAIPIRRRLIQMVLVTSVIAIVFTCALFMGYEALTFRQNVARQIDILGQAIAQNSTAALAFDNADDAHAVLEAFRADPHIVAAALYDKNGALFASYPEGLPRGAVPQAPDLASHPGTGRDRAHRVPGARLQRARERRRLAGDRAAHRCVQSHARADPGRGTQDAVATRTTGAAAAHHRGHRRPA